MLVNGAIPTVLSGRRFLFHGGNSVRFAEIQDRLDARRCCVTGADVKFIRTRAAYTVEQRVKMHPVVAFTRLAQPPVGEDGEIPPDDLVRRCPAPARARIRRNADSCRAIGNNSHRETNRVHPNDRDHSTASTPGNPHNPNRTEFSRRSSAHDSQKNPCRNGSACMCVEVNSFTCIGS